MYKILLLTIVESQTAAFYLNEAVDESFFPQQTDPLVGSTLTG